jgi:hypothetical protein
MKGVGKDTQDTDSIGRDWRTWNVLERIGGHRFCWHGQEDIKGVGKDWRA